MTNAHQTPIDSNDPKIDDNAKALKELERNIDLTRRSRMNAADRLIDQEKFIQGINIYYSCFAAVISIFCLIKTDQYLAIASTIITVVLAMSIIYLNAQHFEKRAQQFHTNFLALYQLLFETKAAIREQNYSLIADLERRYVSLLASAENHTDSDFLRVQLMNDRIRKRKDKSYKKRIRGIERARFVFFSIVKAVVKISLILFPAIFMIYIIFNW